MKCPEIHANIDLYDVLSRQEQEHVDAHLVTCPACRERFEQVMQLQKLLQAAASVHPQPEYPDLVTARIMKAVEQQARPRHGIVQRLVDSLMYVPVRYACAIIAALLITGFIYENSRPQQVPVISHAANGTQPLLNTSVFLQNVRKTSKANRISCLNLCQADAGSTTCSDCKKQFSKRYSRL